MVFFLSLLFSNSSCSNRSDWLTGIGGKSVDHRKRAYVVGTEAIVGTSDRTQRTSWCFSGCWPNGCSVDTTEPGTGRTDRKTHGSSERSGGSFAFVSFVNLFKIILIPFEMRLILILHGVCFLFVPKMIEEPKPSIPVSQIIDWRCSVYRAYEYLNFSKTSLVELLFLSKCFSMVGRRCFLSPGWLLSMNISRNAFRWACVSNSHFWASSTVCGGVFIKRRERKTMPMRVFRVDLFFVVILGKMAKPRFQTNHWRCTKHTVVGSSASVVELHWAPRISGLVRGVHELKMESLAPSGSLNLRLILLPCRLYGLVTGSR